VLREKKKAFLHERKGFGPRGKVGEFNWKGSARLLEKNVTSRKEENRKWHAFCVQLDEREKAPSVGPRQSGGSKNRADPKKWRK